MTAPDDAELAAQRIEQLLAELLGSSDPRAAAVAEELTTSLVQLYGAGLTRIMALLGPDRVADLCADPLVESLLLVHDLHPVAVEKRIQRALLQVSPRRDDIDVVGVDETGVAHLRLRAEGPRCSSARAAVRREIEDAVRRAAPEVTAVDVEIPAPPPPLLQLSPRPGLRAHEVSLGRAR